MLKHKNKMIIMQKSVGIWQNRGRIILYMWGKIRIFVAKIRQQ
jgi:hypothetical protein